MPVQDGSRTARRAWRRESPPAIEKGEIVGRSARWRIVLAFVAFLGLPAMATAQGSLEGTVTAAAGQPLAGVDISLADVDASGLTADDGTYVISAIPAGSHRVSFSRIGFGTEEIEATVRDGGTTRLDVTLGEAAIALDRLVVVGSRAHARTAAESMVPIDVVPVSDLASQGDTDLSTLLRNVVPSYNVTSEPISDAASIAPSGEHPQPGAGPHPRAGQRQATAPVGGHRSLRWKRRRRRGPGPRHRHAAEHRDEPGRSPPRRRVGPVRLGRNCGRNQLRAEEQSVGWYDRGEGLAVPGGRRRDVHGGRQHRAAARRNRVPEPERRVRRGRPDQPQHPARRRRLPGVPRRPRARPRPRSGDCPRWTTTSSSSANTGYTFASGVEFYGHGNFHAKTVTGGFYFRNPNTRDAVFSIDGGQTLLIGDLLDAHDGVLDGSANCPEVQVVNGVPDPMAMTRVRSDPNCFSFQEMFPGGFTPNFGGDVFDASAVAGPEGDGGESGVGRQRRLGNSPGRLLHEAHHQRLARPGDADRLQARHQPAARTQPQPGSRITKSGERTHLAGGLERRVESLRDRARRQGVVGARAPAGFRASALPPTASRASARSRKAGGTEATTPSTATFTMTGPMIDGPWEERFALRISRASERP